MQPRLSPPRSARIRRIGSSWIARVWITSRGTGRRVTRVKNSRTRARPAGWGGPGGLGQHRLACLAVERREKADREPTVFDQPGDVRLAGRRDGPLRVLVGDDVEPLFRAADQPDREGAADLIATKDEAELTHRLGGDHPTALRRPLEVDLVARD